MLQYKVTQCEAEVNSTQLRPRHNPHHSCPAQCWRQGEPIPACICMTWRIWYSPCAPCDVWMYLPQNWFTQNLLLKRKGSKKWTKKENVFKTSSPQIRTKRRHRPNKKCIAFYCSHWWSEIGFQKVDEICCKRMNILKRALRQIFQKQKKEEEEISQLGKVCLNKHFVKLMPCCSSFFNVFLDGWK